MQQSKVVHGFHVTGIDGDGKPSILSYPVLPEYIIQKQPRTPSGSTITYRLIVSGESETLHVVESVEQIDRMIEYCRGLDDQGAGGELKDGKRID